MKNYYCWHNPFYYYYLFRLQSDNNYGCPWQTFFGEKSGNNNLKEYQRISPPWKSRKQDYCISLPSASHFKTNLETRIACKSLGSFLLARNPKSGWAWLAVTQLQDFCRKLRWAPLCSAHGKRSITVTSTSSPSLPKPSSLPFFLDQQLLGALRVHAPFPPSRRGARENIPAPLCLLAYAVTAALTSYSVWRILSDQVTFRGNCLVD